MKFVRFALSSAVLWGALLVGAGAVLIIAWRLGSRYRPDLDAAAATGVPGKAFGPTVPDVIREFEKKGGTSIEDSIEF